MSIFQRSALLIIVTAALLKVLWVCKLKVKKTRTVTKKPWTTEEKQVVATKFINCLVTSRLSGKNSSWM